MAVKILTDSTSYISKKTLDELDIKVASLNVIFGSESYKETDLENESFYEMMEAKGIPSSSQPSVEEMYEAMMEVVEKGNSLLCIFISSDMSGTYQTAHMVKDMILEKYKEAEIEILDSRSNCMQLGFAAVVAARAAKEGQSFEKVVSIAKDNINRSRFLFIPDNLTYLKKGGRIGGASAILGNFLKIIPILTVQNGITSILSKVRTKEKAITVMIEKLIKDASDFGLCEIVVHHINCYDEALDLANRLKKILNIDISIADIGPVIGLHVGPGALGIAYYTEKDMR